MSGLHFAGLVRLSSIIEIGLHFAGLVHLSSWLGPDCMHVAFPASQQGISFADTTLFLAHWIWTSLCKPCPPVVIPWSRLSFWSRLKAVAFRASQQGLCSLVMRCQEVAQPSSVCHCYAYAFSALSALSAMFGRSTDTTGVSAFMFVF